MVIDEQAGRPEQRDAFFVRHGDNDLAAFLGDLQISRRDIGRMVDLGVFGVSVANICNRHVGFCILGCRSDALLDLVNSIAEGQP